MESRHLVIFSTSGKFITKFNALRCISFKWSTILDRARGQIPVTLINHVTWDFYAFKTAVLKQKTNLIHLVCSTIQALVAQWANALLEWLSCWFKEQSTGSNLPGCSHRKKFSFWLFSFFNSVYLTPKFTKYNNSAKKGG